MNRKLVNAIESYLNAEKAIEEAGDKLLAYDDRENKQAKYLESIQDQHEKTMDYAFKLISEQAGSEDLAMQYLNAYSEDKRVFFDMYKQVA